MLKFLQFKNLIAFSFLSSYLMHDKIFHLTSKGPYNFMHLLQDLDHASF